MCSRQHRWQRASRRYLQIARTSRPSRHFYRDAKPQSNRKWWLWRPNLLLKLVLTKTTMLSRNTASNLRSCEARHRGRAMLGGVVISNEQQLRVSSSRKAAMPETSRSRTIGYRPRSWYSTRNWRVKPTPMLRSQLLERRWENLKTATRRARRITFSSGVRTPRCRTRSLS